MKADGLGSEGTYWLLLSARSPSGISSVTRITLFIGFSLSPIIYQKRQLKH